MIQIRNGVFETNSSSVHSICISKKKSKIDTKNVVYFEMGEYGWEHDTVDIKDYLYTAINYFEDREELLERLESILKKHKIRYCFKYCFGKYRNVWLDHFEETREFVEAVLNDEDMLMRLLFNKESVVYTGNDNDDGDYYDSCFVSTKEILQYYDRKKGKWYTTPNPHHNEEEFDYFCKGN